MGLNSLIRFPHEQGFFDRSHSIRVLLSIFFIIALSFFLHFRELHLEMLELNSTASHYIVAQIDFDFVDDEASIILRQEAVRDIGKIYKISEKQIHQAYTELEAMLLQNKITPQKEKLSLDENLRTLDLLQKKLMKLRLTDPRTLQKMQEIKADTSNYQIYTPPQKEQNIVFPEHVWSHFDSLFPTQDKSAALTSMLELLQNKEWQLEEDIHSERRLRKQIQSTIPIQYTNVSAGNRIIDQGEKVSARHLAMLQGMNKALDEQRHLWHPLSIIGSVIMATLIAGICAIYLRFNYPQALASNRQLALLTTIFILTLALSKGAEYLFHSSQPHLFGTPQGSPLEMVRYPLLVPFAAILACNLMNPSIATFVSVGLTIIFAASLTFECSGFIVMNLVAALIAIISTGSLRRRQEVFVVCGKAWLGCAATIFSIHFYENNAWNISILTDLVSAGLFMLITAVLVLGLLPLLESIFSIMSDVTLTEYMDPNHEILRRLSFEAPGTYQHTLVVCNIAEAAALSIGANGLFCRVASLYHDIGKMATPQYFTENQQADLNVHQLLTPAESAQAIISHVSEGVSMARKANLPEQFIDIIKEHHGTTLVYYFYRKQLDLVGGDPKLVNEKEFRYAGPKPRSKESAIIMIADSFEAASRSLEKVDEATLVELINRLIRDKADDGQFDDCLLTFEELGTVKKTMVKTLVAALHSRIKYPIRIRPTTDINA